MFTGIITHIAKVKMLEITPNKDCLLALEISQPISRSLEIGCSIACNGICLTLIKSENNLFYFQASSETALKTNILEWKIDAPINIEFALRMGDELGGHMVLGHIDGCAKIIAIEEIQESKKFTFKLEASAAQLARFIVPKGSICLNGVSLTVNDVTGDKFCVNIIPHTLQHTAFQAAKINDKINVEIDLVARYINKWQN